MAEAKKPRVWELDALRGICLIGMIVVHLFFDLNTFGSVQINLPGWFVFVRSYGHVLFVLISGICATLGSHSFRRGLKVLCCALLITYVTMFMDYVVGIRNIRIWFGILHMLGVCMVVYPLFKRLPGWSLLLIGLAFTVLGFWLQTVTVSVDYFFPIGLRSGRFYCGSDFFPIFPGLGWFLIGAGLGKTVYRKKTSLLPRVNSDFFLLRFFRFCGRNSLPIYLLHQPVLTILTAILF